MKVVKLVRDKIPAIIETKGEKPVFHVATEDEYEKELLKKLREEMGEFFHSGEVLELADMLEVIYTIGERLGYDERKLNKLRKNKREARGGFEKKIILEIE